MYAAGKEVTEWSGRGLQLTAQMSTERRPRSATRCKSECDISEILNQPCVHDARVFSCSCPVLATRVSFVEACHV
jgi:hypothetical protein